MNPHLIRQLKAAIFILVISYFGACAPVAFETGSGDDGGGNVVVRCEGTECFFDIVEEKTVGEGLVDILIVNDNSGSMSTEQGKMANAFSGFLSSIEGLDYRIAMITSDVADNNNKPSPYNGNGKLQNGRLIEFDSGVKFLDRNTPNKQTLFYNTIQRQETLQCEQSNYTQCPSGDERGIYATGMMIKGSEARAFLRPAAHFAVVILSDEDERSVSKYNPCNYSNQAEKANCEAVKRAYPFATMDEPQTFVNSFRSLYPNKTMSFHTIIIRPGDTTCRAAQSNQGGNSGILGFEGYAYAKVRQLVGGVDGNICAANYTNQLKDIGYTISEKITSLPFRCRPVNDKFEVLFNGISATSGYSADFNAMTLTVTADLDARDKVTLKYSCAK